LHASRHHPDRYDFPPFAGLFWCVTLSKHQGVLPKKCLMGKTTWAR
jgi:hypothetical protein